MDRCLMYSVCNSDFIGCSKHSVYYGVVNVALFPFVCSVDVLIGIMEIQVLTVVASARRDKGGVTNSELN